MGLVKATLPASVIDECGDRCILAAQLADPDAIVRRRAVRALQLFPDSAALLCTTALAERDASVREAIFLTLEAMGGPAVVEGLACMLASEDAALRNRAIETLKALPHDIEPYMERLLAAPDPDTRIFAVNVLESLPHPQVEDWLIRVIEQDPHLNVCSTAVDLLGELGSACALPALAALRARFAGEPFIEFAVDLACRRIGAGQPGARA
jgi:HEAT repeat protein